MNKKKKTKNIRMRVIFLFSFILLIIILLCLYKNSRLETNNLKTISTTKITVIPTPTFDENRILGETRIYFTETAGKIYLKQVININDQKLEFPHLVKTNNGTYTYYYSEDTLYEFVTPKVDIVDNNYIWTEIFVAPIKDKLNTEYISISDRIFSFKRIPNSNSFVFAIELDRSDYHLKLFLFDNNKINPQLKLIKTANGNDGKYMSIKVFNCEGCEPGQPETLLVNLRSLKLKNIGKTKTFAWRNNGIYNYKDYVAAECKDETGIYECSQSADILPLKTGQMD